MDQNQIMNFEDYVTQSFDQNKDTISQNGQSLNRTCLRILNVSQIHHKDISKCIWLFRKCTSLFEIEGQQKLFIDYQFIVRHIFLFLFMLIAKYNNNESHLRDITVLMKSIGIIIKPDELQLRIELDQVRIKNLLQTTFRKTDIVQLTGVDERSFQIFLQIWQDIKEIKEPQLRYTLSSFQQELAQINFTFNHKQSEKIKEWEKEQKKIKLKKQQELQQLYQSRIRPPGQVVTKKFCPIVYKQPNRQLQLLPNGNIIIGSLWKKDHTILNLGQDTVINYFYKSTPQLNSYLAIYQGFCKYTGPINEQLEPDTKKIDQWEAVLESVNNMNDQFRYKGAFKNGLFHGKGRMYKSATLDYIGQFKNGVKCGLGYQWVKGDYFLYGIFEQNNKQGKFEFYRCIDYRTKDKVWEKQPQTTYFRNDIELNQLTQTQFFVNDQTPATILLNISQFGINNFQLDSLRPGGWINSSIIDIFLKQVYILKKYMSGDIGVIYINCSFFQDIFGSIITQDSQLNSQPFDDRLKQIQNPKRIVFYFNLDRGHFLTVVYENKKLYLLDSMKDSRVCLLNQMKKLLKPRFEVEDQWADLNQSQQQNSYDCGIYTIYFVSQLIKYQELSIQEMQEKKLFTIEQSAINQIRPNIYQILMWNYSSILKIIQ